ncbi:hypothetical protein PTKIN_Ptkin11bG0115000 [Pterospermum kingtungense]
MFHGGFLVSIGELWSTPNVREHLRQTEVEKGINEEELQGAKEVNDNKEVNSEFHNSEYELDDGDDKALFEKSVHPDVEKEGGEIHSESRTRRIPTREGISRGEIVEDTIMDVNDDIDIEIDEVNLSKYLFSLEDLDSKRVGKLEKKWLEFNSISDMDDLVFRVGMLFASKNQVKEAIKNASIKIVNL